MFRRITLKNFRTHVNTTLDLGSVTLLIGTNNAGKSNFLTGINHFSWLAARGRPITDSSQLEMDDVRRRRQSMRIRSADFFPHRHRIAAEEEPMAFSCQWTHKLGTVEYQIELYKHEGLPGNVGCRETIQFAIEGTEEYKRIDAGWDKPTDILTLRTRLESGDHESSEKHLTDLFFRDLAGCSVYHLQPSLLKGKIDVAYPTVDPNNLRIASHLGHEGANLQKILNLVQEKEPRTFNRFLASLRRFEPSFHGIWYDAERGRTLWQFDLGRVPARLDEFEPEAVSDGLLRAAAIALLSAMEYPPSLILLEEIEDGISQKNLGDFLGWLRQAAGTANSSNRGYRTQFIITSHSPSVVREFSDDLESVYHLRLERRGYRSVASNLNSSLAAFVDLGTIEGEIEEREGRRVVRISPQKLLDLWYSGAIGGES